MLLLRDRLKTQTQAFAALVFLFLRLCVNCFFSQRRKGKERRKAQRGRGKAWLEFSNTLSVLSTQHSVLLFMDKNAQSFLGGRVRVLVGDITREAVDAVVNAANYTLLGGGGVDGAIHDAGGAQILEECRELRRTRLPGGLPTGEAVMTSGGLLPARHVIHTVGPIYGRHGGREPELLASCYRNSLRLAAEHGLKTIAFPSISTGAFGYPRAEAAAVASRAVAEFLGQESTIREVRLVFFSPTDLKAFLQHHKFDEGEQGKLNVAS
jgi:O-acetyl-ADP-ribose deacetylase (regulator of RNase III)